MNEELEKTIPTLQFDPKFQQEIITPLMITPLLSKKLHQLTMNELQRLAIVMTLGRKADVYLFDQPFDHLDTEQKEIVADLIHYYIKENEKIGVITSLSHQFSLTRTMADKVIELRRDTLDHSSATSPT